MSEMKIVNARIKGGVWHGVVIGGTGAPDLEVRHLDQPVAGVDVALGDAGHVLSVPIPTDRISDGVQTFVIFDRSSDTAIGDFTLIAGEALSEDMRAEIELLRAELDMLKRAFRRHCVETA